MQNSNSSSTGSIVGAVFALILLPGSLSLGFGFFVLNAIALACFVTPLVMGYRERCAQNEQSTLLRA